jgi:O-antigen/teichoic acid export membrane protein
VGAGAAPLSRSNVRFWRELGRTRLGQGTAAGVAGLLLQLLLQLLTVPVLTHAWGLAGFGVWVMLFTVPALFAMADSGLNTAGANTMTEAVARGELDRAARIHATMRALTLPVALTVPALAALILFTLPAKDLNFGEHFPSETTRTALLLLCGYGALGLVNGVTLAGYRAADKFALSNWYYQAIFFCETTSALVMAALGGGPAQVALAFCGVRLAGSGLLALGLRPHAPWLRKSGWRADRGELRIMLRPALAALVYPAANAVALQGAVLGIGAVGGPAAVPAFALVRTLSRTMLQFAFRFNVAAMPRFTVAMAQGERAQAVQLIALNLAVTLLLVIPAATGLLLLGQWFVARWTGGLVQPSFTLLAALVLAMLGNALWLPLSNLILAINRHGAFAYFYLAAACIAVGLGTALTATFGATGMAGAMVVLEAVMVVQIWALAQRLGLCSRSELRAALRELPAELRRRTGLGKADPR